MVRRLVENHEAVIGTPVNVVKLAEAGGDSAADLATERLQVHEKTVWMLRHSLLTGDGR